MALCLVLDPGGLLCGEFRTTVDATVGTVHQPSLIREILLCGESETGRNAACQISVYPSPAHICDAVGGVSGVSDLIFSSGSLYVCPMACFVQMSMTAQLRGVAVVLLHLICCLALLDQAWTTGGQERVPLAKVHTALRMLGVGRPSLPKTVTYNMHRRGRRCQVKRG